MAKQLNIHAVKTQYGTFMCSFDREYDMGGYVAESRDVSGAVSWGASFAEAKRMIAEAIEGMIEARVIERAQKVGIVKVIAHPKAKVHA